MWTSTPGFRVLSFISFLILNVLFNIPLQGNNVFGEEKNLSFQILRIQEWDDQAIPVRSHSTTEPKEIQREKSF